MFRTFVSPGLFSFPNFQFLAAPKIPTHEKYHKRRAAQKPTVQERSPQSGPLCFATNQRVDATINLVTLVTCRWLSLDRVTATTMAAMVAALGGQRRRGLCPPDPPAHLSSAFLCAHGMLDPNELIPHLAVADAGAVAASSLLMADAAHRVATVERLKRLGARSDGQAQLSSLLSAARRPCR